MNYSYDITGNLITTSAITGLQIVGQPISQVCVQNDSITFSVVISHSNEVTFQWKFNGVDVVGATNDSLLLTNVSDANEGEYTVVITKGETIVTSEPAVLVLDNDSDGMPDTWKQTYFYNPDETSPLNPAYQHSESDPDKDGISNLDEFLDGTIPTDRTSLRPRLIAYSDVGGTVSVSPMKISYDLGETVTLTATSFEPNVFVGWLGDLSGTDNPISLTLDKNKTIYAKFASAVPIPLGLVALWRGEMDAKDLIGGHDGTITYLAPPLPAPAPLPFTASGKVGNTFNFDGNTYLLIPDADALKPTQITLEAWVYLTTPLEGSDYQTIISHGSTTSDPWYLGIRLRQPEFWTYHSGGLRPRSEPLPVGLPLEEWTHLAASFDGTTQRLYINGVEVAFKEGLQALNYDATPRFITIGSEWHSAGANSLFIGPIDEVAIYNRALSAMEIFNLYKADKVGKNLAQPYFVSPSLFPDMALGHPFNKHVVTLFGKAPLTYSLSAGALAPGLTLSSDGVISGVPSVRGTFDFTVRATDALGIFNDQLCVLKIF